MNILQNMSTPERIRFFVRLAGLRIMRRAGAVTLVKRIRAAAVVGMVLVLLFAAGCDIGATTVPEQLRTTACVVEALAVLDDAIADAKTQDVDGSIALVHAATAVRDCVVGE